jgi:hypothetical protein
LESSLSVWQLLEGVRRYLVLGFARDQRSIDAPHVGANLFALVAQDRRQVQSRKTANNMAWD